MATKILVVDDDPNICDLLKLYFENEGYEVKTASDGAEGVSFFKMYEPDLVLLDIMLPKKDGWQVCREIRESSSKPIIMITAKSWLGSDNYHRFNELTNTEGTGMFACNGKLIPIKWTCGGDFEPFVFTTADGSPLEMERGNTYIAIAPIGSEIIWE